MVRQSWSIVQMSTDQWRYNLVCKKLNKLCPYIPSNYRLNIRTQNRNLNHYNMYFFICSIQNFCSILPGAMCIRARPLLFQSANMLAQYGMYYLQKAHGRTKSLILNACGMIFCTKNQVGPNKCGGCYWTFLGQPTAF